MPSTSDKHFWIESYERRFADILAAVVIERPKLNIWMILIPIIFLHYFSRFQKYNAGRKIFAENFLLTRKRALDEAAAALEEKREPDIARLAELSRLPEQVMNRYSDLIRILCGHYGDLLRAEGEDYPSLVAAAYRTRGEYLFFLNRMNDAEAALNSDLKPFMQQTEEEFDEIVKKISEHSEEMRQKDAERFFP